MPNLRLNSSLGNNEKYLFNFFYYDKKFLMKITNFLLSFIIVSILQLQLHSLFGPSEHEKFENGHKEDAKTISLSHGPCTSCHYLAISQFTFDSPPPSFEPFIASFSYKIIVNPIIITLPPCNIIFSQLARPPPISA